MIKNISATEFAHEMDAHPDAIIIDARTPQEFESGYIKNAQIIDVSNPNAVEKINALAKDRKYLIYCRSGMRSMNMCQYMNQNGFEDVTNLDGGILDWNGPIER
jgi:rhodanese-related sulfurtransferase